MAHVKNVGGGPSDEDPRPPPRQPVDTKGKATKKLATIVPLPTLFTVDKGYLSRQITSRERFYRQFRNSRAISRGQNFRRQLKESPTLFVLPNGGPTPIVETFADS